jgi:hypothetical protein
LFLRNNPKDIHRIKIIASLFGGPEIVEAAAIKNALIETTQARNERRNDVIENVIHNHGMLNT